MLAGRGLDDDEPVLGEKRRQVRGERWQEGVEHPVGRVDEDEIVPPARGCLSGESAPRVVLHDSRALEPELLEVALDRALGLAVRFDEDDRGRTARQRFEAHGAGAREEVEHGHVVDRPDQVERGLAHAVPGRPRLTLRREDSRPLPAPRDDPHERWSSAAQSSISTR